MAKRLCNIISLRVTNEQLEYINRHGGAGKCIRKLLGKGMKAEEKRLARERAELG